MQMVSMTDRLPDVPAEAIRQTVRDVGLHVRVERLAVLGRASHRNVTDRRVTVRPLTPNRTELLRGDLRIIRKNGAA